MASRSKDFFFRRQLVCILRWRCHKKAHVGVKESKVRRQKQLENSNLSPRHELRDPIIYEWITGLISHRRRSSAIERGETQTWAAKENVIPFINPFLLLYPSIEFFNHSHGRFKSYSNAYFQRSFHLYPDGDLFILSQFHLFCLSSARAALSFDPSLVLYTKNSNLVCTIMCFISDCSILCPYVSPCYPRNSCFCRKWNSFLFNQS